ncbi:MAG: hypothetical protein U0556_11695 [Dehalococcoidia bacterium]
MPRLIVLLVACALLWPAALAVRPALAVSPAAGGSRAEAEQATATRVVVLVLANGGKFVGNDIGGALITIRDARTKQVLATGRTEGGSGPADLVTVDINRLQTWPETDASRFVTTLPIDEPRLVEVIAYGPLAAQASAVEASSTVWLLPASAARPENRVVLTLRGLVVQVLSPPTHYLPTGAPPHQISLRANVAMMCGCPIGPSEPWKPEDYLVLATIRGASGVLAVVPLQFDPSAGVPSQFVGEWVAPAAGVFEVVVTASQLTHDNTGVDRATFIVG